MNGLTVAIAVLAGICTTSCAVGCLVKADTHPVADTLLNVVTYLTLLIEIALLIVATVAK